MEKMHSLPQDLGLTPGKSRAVGLYLSDPVSISEAVGDVKLPQFSPGDSAGIHSLIEQFPETLILADRDARMVALEEWIFGKRQDVDNFFMKRGNTISAGLVFDGQVYQGASGCAGDNGRIFIDEDSLECYCGKQGCLVTVFGGRAIDVTEAASQGDLPALKFIDQYGEYVGKVLTEMVQLVNPEAMFIGKGISKIGHRFINNMRQVVLRQVNPMATRDLRMEYSQLG